MIVVAKLKAKKGQEAPMEKELRSMVAKVEAEEGTLMYSLHRSQSDPSVFLFYEKYKDADALKFHSTTPHFKAMFAALQPLIEGQAEIEMYEELAGLNR
jgi:quinol monooxygenase YgiN